MRTQRLLDAAVEVIVDDGLEALTMEAVAERAGVSRALSYFYFENRGALIRSLYNREFGRIYDAMVPAFEAGGTLEERVRAGVKAYFDIVASRYDLFAVLDNAVYDMQARRDRRHRMRSWEQYMGLLVGSEFHLTTTRAGILARLFMDVVSRCTVHWKRDGLDRAEVEQLCVHFILGGLRSVLSGDEASATI